MGSHWAPKPLRPIDAEPLFPMVESPLVVKGLSPIEAQRVKDGSPHTVTGRTGLRAPDPVLSLNPALVKGSLAGELAKKHNRNAPPNMDPTDAISVVKAFMSHNPDAPSPEEKKKMDKSLAACMSAIQNFQTKTGTK